MLPVRLSPPAEKYLRKIKDKQLKRAFEAAILTIRENPYIGERKKERGKLAI